MTTQTYCPEIKETIEKLRKLKEYGGCNDCRFQYNKWELCINCRIEYRTLIRELQTHLSHAEKDLIDVEDVIDELMYMYQELLSNFGLKEDICFMIGITQKIEQKQLRKTEIEEAIKLIKEGLK